MRMKFGDWTNGRNGALKTASESSAYKLHASSFHLFCFLMLPSRTHQWAGISVLQWNNFLRESPSVNVTSLVWTLLAIATKHFPGVRRTMLSLFLPCRQWKQLVCPFLVQECQLGQRARMVYNKVLYLSWLGGLCTHCCFLPAWWWLLACQLPFAVIGTAQKGKRKGRPQVAGYRLGVGERWDVAWGRLIRKRLDDTVW